jgi:ABC-type uncharacterized transport system involved in gliding motility auxiliary subunit
MSRLGKISFIFAIVSLLCFAISKSIIHEWIPFFWVLIGLFALFIAVGFFVDRKFFAEFFSMKTTKHGMNMGVLIVGFVGLVILANVLGARHYKTWDFSVTQINTLSDQSVKILKDLKGELKIIYLYKENGVDVEKNRKIFTEIIRRYQDQSDKIKLEFIEADEQPDIAQKYQFKGAQAIYLDYNGKTNRIDKLDEQTITSAMVKVTREKSKTVYFTAGHGEPDIDSMDKAEALGFLKTLLGENNYTVKTINFSATSKLPEDLDVLMIAGVQYPFQKFDLQILEAFLKSGGNLLVSLNYPDKSGLDKFLAKLGVEILPGYVANVFNLPTGPVVDPKEPTKATSFSPTNSITKVFSKNDGVVMLKPLAFKRAAQVPTGLTVEELVSAPSSVLLNESHLKNEVGVGNFNVAMAVSGVYPEGGNPTKPFNMVVLGDSNFLENQLLYGFVNRDIVLNSVALLAKEDNLISISPKEPPGTKIEMTSAKEAALFWGFFLPMPLIFLIASLYFWIRRRHA